MVEWIAAFPGAALLRASATVYLLVNAAHVLGLGVMLGAILPLDLRLIGLFRSVPLDVIGPFLVRVAAAGLGLALVTGFLLFTVRPREYLANPAFLAKLALLGAALANIALQHATGIRSTFVGWQIARLSRALAATSAALWLGVLIAGRTIGFI